MQLLEKESLKVTLGATVTVRDVDTGDVEVYTLVPPGQADITANRISSTTPLAHAVYGRGVGDEVTVDAPGGAVRLVIEEVTPQPDDDEYG